MKLEMFNAIEHVRLLYPESMSYISMYPIEIDQVFILPDNTRVSLYHIGCHVGGSVGSDGNILLCWT